MDPARGEVAFGAYVERWLVEQTKPITQRTMQTYRSLLDLHFLPRFGGVNLGAITIENLRRWHADASQRSQLQAAKAYRLRRATLNTAASDGPIGRKPCVIGGASRAVSDERS